MAARKSAAETAVAKIAADVLSPVQKALHAVEAAAQANLTAIKELDSAEVTVMAAENRKRLTRDNYVEAMYALDTTLMGENEFSERLHIRAY